MHAIIESLRLAGLLIAIICLAATCIGMLQPWRMLWWAAYKNRMKILEHYTLPGLLAWVF